MKKNRRERGSARYTERSALARISQEVVGMIVSRAFVVAKSAGFKLKVNKLDGLPLSTFQEQNTVNVVVVDGTVRKSWFTEDLP